MPTTNVRISGGSAAIEYEVTGTGPGLVLVHGTAASREQWLPLIEAVADRFAVLALDYSGSGGTTDHGGPLTLADLAEEVLAVADHADLDGFHLVGHSLGSAIATHLAATHPERVRSLALHAGWVYTDTRMAAEFRYWLELLRADAEHGTSLFAQMLPLAAFGPRYWERTSTEANAELVAQLTDVIAPGAARQTEVDLAVDLRAALDRITAPTLVLASAHDRVVDADQQRALVAGIARSRYAEIDAGHGAPAEDPAGFASRIAGFLDEQAAKPSAIPAR
jgi:pimeloyl-ACP methyl ester carboxylesterase